MQLCYAVSSVPAFTTLFSLSFFPDCSPYIAVAVGTFVGAFGVDECKNFIRLRLRKLLGADTSEDKENKTDND